MAERAPQTLPDIGWSRQLLTGLPSPVAGAYLRDDAYDSPLALRIIVALFVQVAGTTVFWSQPLGSQKIGSELGATSVCHLGLLFLDASQRWRGLYAPRRRLLTRCALRTFYLYYHLECCKMLPTMVVSRNDFWGRSLLPFVAIFGWIYLWVLGAAFRLPFRAQWLVDSVSLVLLNTCAQQLCRGCSLQAIERLGAAAEWVGRSFAQPGFKGSASIPGKESACLALSSFALITLGLLPSAIIGYCEALQRARVMERQPEIQRRAFSFLDMRMAVSTLPVLAAMIFLPYAALVWRLIVWYAGYAADSKSN